MEAVAWSELSSRHASLPKLRMKQESTRRDSLSSSRTGDSGYISDPDISLSPLDFVGADQLPGTTPTSTFNSTSLLHAKDAAAAKHQRSARGVHSSILVKIHKDSHKEFPLTKAAVTSNPTTSTGTTNCTKPDWTKAFKRPLPEADLSATLTSSLTRNDEVEHWVNRNLRTEDRPKERNHSVTSLSSTGSCDMYSITDDSDDDEVLGIRPSTMSKATRKTIELIMRKIEVNLSYVAYIQCAGNHASRGQGASSTSSRTSRGTAQGPGGKRKARSDDNPPEDPGEDESNKRRRVSITTTEDSESGPRFACPFYKHDPNRYRNRRTCPGPGWPTVHRMKEHLYRSHAQPIYCPRCYAMFDSDSDFSAHLRSHPCQISAPQPIEGIDRETLTNLRKRSPALRLEEDKWRDTYQLLFPEVSTPDIPSPYYDNDSPSEESRRFRRELLERIRRELFATADQEAGPIEQRLLRQVAGIIQRCENELLGSIHSTPTHLRSAASTSRRTSAVSTHAEATTMQGPPLQSPAPTSNLSVDAAQLEGLSPGSHPPYAPSDAAHDVSESTAQYSSLFAWNDSLQFTSSEWIDWNAVFPQGLESQGPERNEPLPALNAPVWT